jgi:predicted dehydrogenase
MTKNGKMNRRTFLKNSCTAAAGIVGFPYIVRSSALAQAGNTLPSDKIVLGCIGTGWQGTSNMQSFMTKRDARVVAVCDIDKNHLENAKKLVDEKYAAADCTVYHDYRELLARDDIDAVSIGLPDHWHAIASVDAARAGKDIYGEKPLSYTFNEGLAICDAIKQYGRVWQTGSWQRSQKRFRFACELVRNGRIGKVHTVEVGLYGGHNILNDVTEKDYEITAPPPELDYETWLGPAPWAPYCRARVHINWRWILDYGGGQLMDWVGHHVDIAHWGMGFDYSGPLEIEATGEYPSQGLYNSPTKYLVVAKYPGDVTMIITGGYDEIRTGTKWIGDRGWVWVERSGFEVHPAELAHETFSANEINLYRSPGHPDDFLNCIKSRGTTLTPCEVAHRSATPGHLGGIAMALGRKIRFNPQTQEIIGDDTATKMLSRPMRSPWHL